MPYLTKALLVIAAAAFVFCTPYVNMHSATLPTARFERYATFAFVQGEAAPSQYASTTRSAEARNCIQSEAQKVLEAKGYRFAAHDKADLVLWIAAGSRERQLRRPTAAVPGLLEEDEEEDFTEGAFVIDAFDAAANQLVWHGSARTEIDPNRFHEDRLRSAVRSVLRTFPARPHE